MITDPNRLTELRDHRVTEMSELRQRLAEIVPNMGATHLVDYARRLFVLEYECSVLADLVLEAGRGGESAVKDLAYRLLLRACDSPIPERREGTERILRVLEGRA